MKLIRGDTEKEVVLEFEDLREFESFFEDTEQRGSFLLADSSLRLDAIFRARVVGSPRTRIIRPKKIFREQNSFVVHLERVESPASQPEVVSRPEPAPMEAPAVEPAKSSAEKIKSLTVTEKYLLAAKADLADRRILMQDVNPKIQEFLLRNPRITESEVAWIARNPLSAIPTLFLILERKDWMSTDSIRQGIFTNPKTPSHILLEKIPGMAAGDLIKMHQARNLRNDVRDLVQREMKKRGIRIRND